MRSLLITVAVVVGLTAYVDAQILQKSVISSGAVASSNGTMSVVGTIGQTLIGTTTAPSVKSYNGFWFTASATADQPLHNTQPSLLSVTPHPVTSVSTLNYTNTCAGVVRMDLHTLEGKHVESLYDGIAPTGELTTMLDSKDLASGLYLVVSTTNCGTTSSLLIIRH